MMRINKVTFERGLMLMLYAWYAVSVSEAIESFDIVGAIGMFFILLVLHLALLYSGESQDVKLRHVIIVSYLTLLSVAVIHEIRPPIGDGPPLTRMAIATIVIHIMDGIRSKGASC